MVRALVLAAALIALTGCATHADPKPAVCDGKHRRPANPYGSVLPSVPGAAPDAPKPAEPVQPAAARGPQSSIDPRSFAPCGAAA